MSVNDTLHTHSTGNLAHDPEYNLPVRPVHDCAEDRKTQYLVLYAICHSLSAVFVGLRIYTRVFIVKYFGRDDIWILISMVIGNGIVTYDLIFVFEHAQGVHVGCINPDTLVKVLKIKYIGDPFFSVALQTVRMSLLTFYLRLSAGPTFRKIVVGSMIATWSICIIFLVIFELGCIPPSKAWSLEVIYANTYDRYCLNKWALSWAWSVFAILCDCWVLLLPVKMLMALRIGWKEKIIVLGIFGIGSLACIASIIRIPALKFLYQSPDPLWDQYIVTVCSTVEWNLCVMAACCPALKPLVTKMFPHLLKMVSQGGSLRSRPVTENGSIRMVDPSVLETGATTLVSSNDPRSSSIPHSPSKMRKISMLIPSGRLNELGMAPQMPPGERFGWQRFISFFRRKESITGQDPAHIGHSEASDRAGPNVGFWGNRNWDMDMNHNDYCVNPNYRHQLPQRSRKSSRKDSIDDYHAPT
ncbi:hypothetical protein H072_10028 [Dactylellina haptotyla CBS 200.50]|uniref:Rhodopsin domain-containing protein n=1 Tax=Dactylellina haptotyla (strain CBS 200.50) TaxID=1284197 RepID=S8A5P7_DACHA|nr:hypothetical protein H072_10028 [Dactylellina haptotyla CBS 200.50]